VRRAGLYLRQSDSSCAGDTSLCIASQDTAGRAWCIREDCIVVAVEIDTDLRGWQDDTERPGLARILTLAESRAIDVLVVWDLSRLARSVRIQEMIVWRLARAGVELVSLTEPHAGDALLRQILGAIAEHRPRGIAGHVRRALRERTTRGLPHSIAPYGYRRVEPAGRYEPDPDSRETVRQIFTSYADGAGLATIADDLTARGIPCPARSGPWRLQTVRYILRNPAYVGRVGPVEDAHEAIVPTELWHRVQARLDSTRRVPRRKPHSSWLEGHIFHGCGRPMYLSGPQGRMTGPAFRCQAVHYRRVDGEACPVRPYQVMAARLEAAVWSQVQTALAHLVSAEDVARGIAAEVRAAAPLVGRQRREIEARVDRARQRRTKAEDLHLSGSRDRAWFGVEDARLAAELAFANDALDALPTEPDVGALRTTEAELRTLATRVGRLLPADRGAVLAWLGVAVVDGDGVRIEWRAEVAAFLADRVRR